MNARQEAVFLDRDGTVTESPPLGDYVREPGALRLVPGAGAAIARLNASGRAVVLVTNQRWIGANFERIAAYRWVHDRLCALLSAHTAHLDAHRWCPHQQWSCGCRKPAAGMILNAARVGNYDLGCSVTIGDSAVDVAAGQAAGTATVRVGAGDDGLRPTARAADLAEAVDVMGAVVGCGGWTRCP